MVDLVAIFAHLTTPSFPGCTWTILPNGHWPRCTFSSTTKTKSPVAKLRLGLVHFWRSWRVGRYSESHRFQNTFDKYWICLHRRLQYMSSSEKTPGGMMLFGRKRSRWLGVKASKYAGLSLLGVRGRPFKIHSISVISFRSASPETSCSFMKHLITFRTDRITHSQTAPIWEAPGGLNFHWMPFSCRYFSIFWWFQVLMSSRIFFSSADKLVLLSLLTDNTWTTSAANKST